MDATPDWPRSPSPSSPSSPNMMARRWARRLERYCCLCFTYFPLAFVYGLTSWAVFVVVSLCNTPSSVSWLGKYTHVYTSAPVCPAPWPV